MEKEWKPHKNSRLCANHFHKIDYQPGQGKNTLKTTAVPTIEYCFDTRKKYRKIKPLNSCNDMEQTNKRLKVKPVDSNNTNVEIVELNYNDINNLNHEHQNKGNSYDHEENCKNESENLENEKCTSKNKYLNFSNMENSNDNQDDSSHDEALKNDICNRENQYDMFTSSFKEDSKPIVLIPPEDKPSKGSLDINIDHPITKSKFKKIMASKLKKKQLTSENFSFYFKALKKLNFQHQEQMSINFLNSDIELFATSLKTQMEDFIQHKKVYLSVKHKIHKILMQAQLKIENSM